MARKKPRKTKEYYRKTTTLKRTGISQYDRDAAINLCAWDTYQPHRFCEIAEQFKFKSCAQFKKAVAARKRRLTIQKRARQRVIDKMPPFSWGL